MYLFWETVSYVERARASVPRDLLWRRGKKSACAVATLSRLLTVGCDGGRARKCSNIFVCFSNGVISVTDVSV
jgi:hypothetical protein